MKGMSKKDKILKILVYLGIIFTFLILDIGLRYLVREKIGFVSVKSYAPLAFSLSYITILILLMHVFKKKAKIIYIVATILANIYFFAQLIHFKILSNFFSLVSLFSAGEATDYLDYVFKTVTDEIIIVILLSILSMITVLNLMKSMQNKLFRANISKRFVLIFIVVVILLRITSIYKLGKSVEDFAWDAWKTPKNVYNNYSNNNRSMMVSGVYEYVFRDAYLYLKKILFANNKKEIKEINEYLNNQNNELYKNEYTGIFKDKNLIIIMLESIDNWLVTEEVMPTMYELSREGLNFTNRYAPFYGSGMTINSEFAGISGLYSITTDKAIYNYNLNNFDYSLPNLFKKEGYIVNSMHMNDGDFYNRKNFHEGLGFTHHYPLYQMGFNENFNYDTNIVKNDNSYDLIINQDKFVTFITTYSAHVPYIENAMCDKLAQEHTNLLVKNNEELSCIRLLANETDNFLKLLLNRLEDDGYLDNTVIVLYTDHYAYGYDKVSDIKGTKDSNLIQKTPLIIWSKDIPNQDIDTIMDTADIPVTLFNMFGINYEPKLYMGTDVFSNKHEQFVYFNDYSWYDGVYYSKDDKEDDYTKKISEIVNQKININQKIIHSDFYKYYEKNK